MTANQSRRTKSRVQIKPDELGHPLDEETLMEVSSGSGAQSEAVAGRWLLTLPGVCQECQMGGVEASPRSPVLSQPCSSQNPLVLTHLCRPGSPFPICLLGCCSPLRHNLGMSLSGHSLSLQAAPSTRPAAFCHFSACSVTVSCVPTQPDHEHAGGRCCTLPFSMSLS